MMGGADAYRPDDLALRASAGALVQAAGGQEAAAAFARFVKRHQSIGEYGLPDGGRWMRIDVVRDLERVTRNVPGWPIVTRHLAAEQGFALVQLPPAGGARVADWHGHMKRLARGSAEMTAHLCEALAGDGAVTADEVRARGMIAEGRAAITALVELVTQLEAVAEGG